MIKIKRFFFIGTVLFLISQLSFKSGNAIGTDETGIKAVLDGYSDEIIIDIRWEDIYNKGHLSGAYLIDSSLSEDIQYQQAISILQDRNANASTPIIMLCNCEGGHLASNMEVYLNSVGYKNTYHLSDSFSLWSDPSYLISGPSVTGNSYLSSIPDFNGSPAPSPLNNPIFIFALFGIGGIGLYFLFRNPSNTVSTNEIQKKVKKSEEKKKIQIEEMKKSLGEQEPVIQSKKHSARRRR